MTAVLIVTGDSFQLFILVFSDQSQHCWETVLEIQTTAFHVKVKSFAFFSVVKDVNYPFALHLISFILYFNKV